MVHSPAKRLYHRFFKPGLICRLTSHLRVLPDFLILGAMRSGTTSLQAMLADHPQVVPALKKEIHFFDLNYQRGPGWYRAHFATRRHMAGRLRRGLRAITGETSPYYLFHPLAAQRAAALLPETRLIAILRDPVQRAYSHYWHGIRTGFEQRSFEQAIAEEGASLQGEAEKIRADESYASFAHQHHSYLARGRYLEQLQAWLAHFPTSQLLVLAYEQLFRRPDEIRRLFDFLGIDANRVPAIQNHNVSRYPALDEKLRAELAAYFRPHNQALFAILDQEFDWLLD